MSNDRKLVPGSWRSLKASIIVQEELMNYVTNKVKHFSLDFGGKLPNALFPIIIPNVFNKILLWTWMA